MILSGSFVQRQTPSSRALSRTPTPLDRVQNDAGAERQLLGYRMGSYQLFQYLALVGHLGEGLASSN
jgi:hypothetical protein